MDHRDHVALLRPAVTPGGRWADIGAGDGAFTLALADLLGPGGRIVAVDRDRGALARNAEALRSRFPAVEIEAVTADFDRAEALQAVFADRAAEADHVGGSLDGLVAANSLHFVKPDRREAVVKALAAHLRPGGRFVIVEYDSDSGNRWVPHPFRLDTWERLAKAVGLVETRRLGYVPSRFLGGIYSAESRRTLETAPR